MVIVPPPPGMLAVGKANRFFCPRIPVTPPEVAVTSEPMSRMQ